MLRLFLLLPALITSAFADSRPNIIFILSDDQRQDSLPIYGNEFVSTPNIDELAAESMVFDNASVTSAICMPSRACYFLGQYERRHAVNFNSGLGIHPDAWAQSYPQVLRDSGYHTGYIGKNHVPVGEDGYKTGHMEKSFDFWYAGHGHIFFYPKERHPIFRNARADTQIEILTEGTLNFLDQRPADEPFCLSICLNLPHGAGTTTMKQLASDDPLYRTTYRDRIEHIAPPLTFAPRTSTPAKLPADVHLVQYRQKIYDYADHFPTLRERMLRQYQTVTGIDRMIGHIRRQLTALGIADNTVIIYSSDHGLMLGEHGLGGKALNYEQCLQVPFIIHDPRLPAERRSGRTDSLVQSIDVAPTILELAGIALPDTIQGKSLVPLLQNPKKEVRQYSFAENLWSNIFGNPRIESLRGQRYKYIRYFANDHSLYTKRWETKKYYGVSPKERKNYLHMRSASIEGERPVYEELFDLQTDPGETSNLAADPDHFELLSKMRQACQTHVVAAHGAPSAQPVVSELPLTLTDED